MNSSVKSKAVSTLLNLKETELHYLVGKALRVAFGMPQNILFFEVPVGNSRADILYVQSPESIETLLKPGVHVFEVKMRWDNDKQRLYKQLQDYITCSDYVWVVGVNHVLDVECENVGVLVYSTLSSRIRIVRPARRNDDCIDLSGRQGILSTVAHKLRKKYQQVEDMARVNPVGENRTLVQQKLVV